MLKFWLLFNEVAVQAADPELTGSLGLEEPQ